METKQVLVMRKFKNMRIGKYCAQASHASLASYFNCVVGRNVLSTLNGFPIKEVIDHWLEHSFRKITLYVETEEELVSLKDQCDRNNIPCALITDNGTTEFGGVPTVTALGIGPWLEEEINEITSNLKLF